MTPTNSSVHMSANTLSPVPGMKAKPQ